MENWRQDINKLSLFDHTEITPQIETVEEFLHQLGGPSYFVIDGHDNSRTRVLVTLLHGNEPSGVMALLRWLKQNQKPAVRIICIIASVNTALTPPLFHYRKLPGTRDLNRCFQAPFEDEQGKLAKEILDLIHQHQPEAVIDMHNTSGSGPAFGAATHDDLSHHALTYPFSNQLVITHLRLGALMDISEEYYPTVTIEVGGRLDQAAHEVAWKGINHYFSEKDIFKSHTQTINTIIEPIRLELKSGVSLSYATTANAEFDVTLLNNVDTFNFQAIHSQTHLGWVNHGDLNNFVVSDCKLQSKAKDWIRIENGHLYPATDVTLFMITTNPVIAIDDCLFYGVRRK